PLLRPGMQYPPHRHGDDLSRPQHNTLLIFPMADDQRSYISKRISFSLDSLRFSQLCKSEVQSVLSQSHLYFRPSSIAGCAIRDEIGRISIGYAPVLWADTGIVVAAIARSMGCGKREPLRVPRPDLRVCCGRASPSHRELAASVLSCLP